MSFYSVFRYGVLQNSDASDKILLFIRNFFYLYKIPNYNLLNKFILRNKKKIPRYLLFTIDIIY